MPRSIGILRGGWGLTGLHLVCFMFFLGVFGTANSMLHVLPIPLILWALPLVAAVLIGVAAVGVGDRALDGPSRMALAIRLTLILLAVGVGLTAAGRALGNADLIVYGFAGNPALGRLLAPGAALMLLNLAGLWLGGRIALSGTR
ncbi:hypothetical protein [Paracoccus laeviglucosivorans]|uniref:Uncharacterized protein n=1 Tax=Paracoccus laeviglucosivorans TaxID=1197861 RepID=A0A521CRJ1_9RHOB|nr:hypothetical protein [Paracoccus laeviglucosivorans]SMO61995.1 hypothetical protein SAMN06265221_10587 [Paracoccus laeviglucosivorans]